MGAMIFTLIFELFLGAVIGLGVWLISLGVRGKKVLKASRSELSVSIQSKKPNHNFRNIILGSAIGVGIWLFTGIFVAGLVVGIGIVLFRGKLGSKRSTHKITEKSESIASWTEMLHSVFLAGGGIEKAIISSAAIAPEPIREEVRALAKDIETSPIADALYRFGVAMAHPASDKIVAALALSVVKGAHDIVELLRSQAESIRADSRVILELEEGRARHRTSALIVMSVTLTVATALYFFEKGYLSPYKEFPGYFVLFVVGVGFLGGFGLLIQMGKINEPSRHFELKEGIS